MDFGLPRDRPGVLPAQWLAKAIEAGVLSAAEDPIPDRNIQPASIDLRLGPVAYRLRCSFLASNHTVESKLRDFALGPPLDLSAGAVLEQNRPYLIPLMESLDLPDDLVGRANPKSSTGRLDVFTRVITDRSFLFDDIRAGYRGGLWLEVFSRSFTIEVRQGLALNQLRLRTSQSADLSDEEVRRIHDEQPILFRDDEPLPASEVRVNNGLFLSLDLRRSVGVVGYRAKQNSHLLDLSKIEHYEPAEFWDDVRAEDGDRVVLEPEAFYLLLSDEAVRIPPELASEMNPYDPTSGELRTHYAGFFDPGFGHSPAGLLRGSRAALEVRAHDVPFVVDHRQRICKLSFERMLEEPARLYGDTLSSNYQSQIVTLSKHFKVERRRSTGQLGLDDAAAEKRAR